MLITNGSYTMKMRRAFYRSITLTMCIEHWSSE